jgi:cytochrome b subunit of formate dehydrogenase
MELFRRAANPWNQEVLIGVSWDLMWAAVIAGIAFMVAHALLVMGKTKRLAEPAAEAAGIPEKIERHSMGARAFHWLMAVAMFALLVTAFVPVIGLQFPWVTIHWVAGVALIATIVYHVFHSILKEDFWSMWTRSVDVKRGMMLLKNVFTRSDAEDPKTGKYGVDHQLYHHAVMVLTVAAIVTGVLMMFRIDTPFWERNPYLLSDGAWGIVYVVHGLSGVALITMVMTHVYFAIRPEKLWLTRSMIFGFIDRSHYLEHFDPEHWKVGSGAGEALEAPSGGALAETAAQSPHESV